MKIYKTQAEVDADLSENGDLILDCSVKFEFSVKIKRDIKAGNIDAWDIKAGNIKAGNIDAVNIKAGNIDACDIKAGDIDAVNIDAWDIEAGDINAWNIKAGDIKAGDISFFAFCVAYVSIKCKSWTARREKHLPPQCLDGTLTVAGNVTEVRCG